MFKFLFLVMGLILVLVVTWPLTNRYLAFTYTVTGSAMAPNLKDKDYLLIQKNSIFKPELKRGDIVLLNSSEDPSRLLLQRIVGMPKERLVIQGGYVYINENPLSENYLTEGTQTPPGEVLYEGYETRIPANSYFVLNDRRSDFTDSRLFGTVDQQAITGKLWFKIY